MPSSRSKSPKPNLKAGARRPSDNLSSYTRNIQFVALGNQVIATWYPSFYPDKLVSKIERLYVCEYCFKYTTEASQVLAHAKFCPPTNAEPIGRQVYQKDQYSIYEVDGEENTLFCQCLSLFAKMFLDNKSIYYDVEGFLFYTLLERDSASGKQRIVGFFSKEKMSWDDYNLACILVFPPFQKRGLGNILIAFSYELARLEGKVGSPEKPLSDLGHKGYMKYWTSVIADTILKTRSKATISVKELSDITFIHPEDVLAALHHMDALTKAEDGSEAISKDKIREWSQIHRINSEPIIDVSSVIAHHQ
ncbi:SAS complex subunit [Rhizina undulata]